MEFFCDAAPQTVSNFVVYAEDGFYDGTIFHRIIQSFMIQGGGFTPEGEQKQTRAPVPLEYEVPNARGNVAMARTGDPNSATSQFFINTVDNSQRLGPGGADQYGYTVFARVTEGMEVVDAIAAEPTGQGPQGQGDWPQDPPVIESVRAEGTCEEEGENGADGENGAGDENGEEGELAVEAGLMVKTEDDGVWHAVVAQEDHVPFWVRNSGDRQGTFDLTVEAPEAWEVELADDSVSLGRGGQGGDAAASYLTLRLQGESSPEDTVTLRVSAQDDPDVETTLTIRLGLQEDQEARVSGAGDEITISYTGSFDDGEVFDSGSFSTTVRSGETVPGFDTGLLGIAEGETVETRFPPDLGYGYNPPQHMAQFAGEWLTFEVTVDAFEA